MNCVTDESELLKKLREAADGIKQINAAKEKALTPELTAVIKDVCAKLPEREYSESELNNIDALLDNMIIYKQTHNERIEGVTDLIVISYHEHARMADYYNSLALQSITTIVPTEWIIKKEKHLGYCTKLKQGFPEFFKEIQKKIAVLNDHEKDFSYL